MTRWIASTAIPAALVCLAACAGGDGASTRTDPDRSGTPAGVEDLVLAADVAVMESFPVQLRGSLTVRNPTDEPVRFEVGGCPAFLRAYRSADGGPVWDQGNGAVCIAIVRTIMLEPGGAEIFQTATAGAGEILGDDLPDGKYRVAVYLALAGGGEREAEAGEVDLAIPR